jgi:4-hydroxy-tetrahydrodipicolinate reductase
MSLIKLGINGANGKMGKEILSVINSQQNNFKILAMLTSSSSVSDVETACKLCDVIIDFSQPEAIKNLTYFAAKHFTKIVIGTTGLKSEHFQHIESAAKDTAIIYAPNTSIGANILQDLAIRATRILKDYDVEIVEAHHRYKKDSPSGTAIAIGQSIAKAKQIDFAANAIFDRYNKGPRKKDDIAFSSIRGGGIFGEHEVIFAGEDELVTIEHKALSRRAFAEGAVKAALWIAKKTPGLYSMRDVLEL